MKAAVFYKGGEPLKVETVEDPTPEATEVIIEVKHCGIGHEYAGEIVAMGKDAPAGRRIR